MAAAVSTKRVAKFFKRVRNVLMAQSPMESMLFDCQGLAVFAWLVDHYPTDGRPLAASTRNLAEEVMVPRTTVTRRLQLLSRYAMVKCEVGYTQVNGQRRICNHITVNPNLMVALTDGNDERKQLVKGLVAVGLWRGDGDGHLQGFNSHVAFGTHEPLLLPGTQLSNDVGSDLFDLAVQQAAEVPAQIAKRAKEQERQERVARHNEYVTGAGKLWTQAQVACGRMKATDPVAPAWVTNNTGTHKKERQEITTLLETYGGMRTGMAWMYFCTARPILEAEGKKPKFRLDIPHIQYVSDDKKPMQFAKHFNSILGDHKFQSWENDPAKQARVVHYFGEALSHYTPNGGTTSQQSTPMGAQA